MAVIAECPVFEGTWGERGECGLIGKGKKIQATDSREPIDPSCTPADQVDFVDFHGTVDLKDPPTDIRTEGSLRQRDLNENAGEKIQASRCPLVNSGTCDIARGATNGTCGLILQAQLVAS